MNSRSSARKEPFSSSTANEYGDVEKGEQHKWFSILMVPVYIHHASVYIKNMCLVLCFPFSRWNRFLALESNLSDAIT